MEFPELGIAGQCKRSTAISAECRRAEDMTLPDINRTRGEGSVSVSC